VRTIAAFDLLARFANGAQLRSCSWHAFTSLAVAELITAELATAKSGRMRAGQRTVDVTRVRITDAGRAALGR